jgi:hypothetical protein
LAAFASVGSQFCYAEDLLDTVLNTCVGYVRKQIPDSLPTCWRSSAARRTL